MLNIPPLENRQTSSKINRPHYTFLVFVSFIFATDSKPVF